MLLLISHVSECLRGVDQIFAEMFGKPFFFSNILLSFHPAVPRIRLRFQTLLSGFSAISKRQVRAGDDFSEGSFVRGAVQQSKFAPL
jgi:hypothetical protein